MKAPGRNLVWACLLGSVAVHAATLVVLRLLPPAPPIQLSDSDSGPAFTDLTLHAETTETQITEPPQPPPAPEPAPTPKSTQVPDLLEPVEPPPAPPPQPPAASALELVEPAPPPAPPSERPPIEKLGSSPAAPAKSTPLPRESSAPAPVSGPVSFAGAKVLRASTIVYAVDASGAMASSLSIVFEELRRSVARLTPEQKFTVLLFREPLHGGSAEEWFAPAPVAATSENLRALDRFLKQARPGGRSNPLRGLEPAVRLKPDLVFFLARSIPRSGGATWGPGRGTVLDRLEELNPINSQNGSRPVVIKTIQFIEPDATGLMHAVGTLHGDGPGSAVVFTLPSE